MSTWGIPGPVVPAAPGVPTCSVAQRRSIPKVVIIGAGFGGLAAARHLGRAPAEVVVVDQTSHHLFQPLLYQVATGILSPGEIAPPIRSIFSRRPGTSVILAKATDLHLSRREIDVCGPDGRRRSVSYDYLVVAAGARDSYFGHEEWARHLFPMKSLAQAVALRERVLASYERAAEVAEREEQRRWTTFVVVGGGPTGVELSGQLATVARQMHREYRRVDTDQARIVLVEGGQQLLASFAEPLRHHARARLAEMGVEVRLASMAVNVDGHGIDIRSHAGRQGQRSTERIPAGTVIWAAGVEASPLGRLLGEATGAAVDHQGRVRVAPDCSLPGHPEVFAIGDLAAVDDLPGLCEPAMQEGRYVAKLIRRRLAGRPPPGPFRYTDLGTMATISPGDAVAQVFGLRLSGLPAQLAWALVHITFLVGWGNRAGVLSRWAHDIVTHSRSERVILSGLGEGGVLDRLAHSDQPTVTGQVGP